MPFENYITKYENLKNGNYRITLKGNITITYKQGEFIKTIKEFQFFGKVQRKYYFMHRKRYLKLKKIYKIQKEILETCGTWVVEPAFEETKRIPRSKLSNLEISIIETFRATKNAIFHAEINYKDAKRKLEENIFKFEKFIECNNKIEAVKKIEKYNPKTPLGYKFVNSLYEENF